MEEHISQTRQSTPAGDTHSLSIRVFYHQIIVINIKITVVTSYTLLQCTKRAPALTYLGMPINLHLTCKRLANEQRWYSLRIRLVCTIEIATKLIGKYLLSYVLGPQQNSTARRGYKLTDILEVLDTDVCIYYKTKSPVASVCLFAINS